MLRVRQDVCRSVCWRCTHCLRQSSEGWDAVWVTSSLLDTKVSGSPFLWGGHLQPLSLQICLLCQLSILEGLFHTLPPRLSHMAVLQRRCCLFIHLSLQREQEQEKNRTRQVCSPSRKKEGNLSEFLKFAFFSSRKLLQTLVPLLKDSFPFFFCKKASPLWEAGL